MKKILTSPPSGHARSRRDAFSLIEVVLAIGVMAIAVIPLMALLPNGLTSYRMASDSMTQTAISRYVSSFMASKTQTPSNWPTNDLYFSDEMTILTNGSSNAAYRVAFTTPTNGTNSFAQESLPSEGSANGTTLDRLWRVSYVVWDSRANRIIGSGGFELADREKNTN